MRLARTLLALVLVMVAAPPVLGADLTLITRNLYLGADLLPVATATTPDAFVAAAQVVLAQIAANDFPERAVALADEIADRRPHVVALQEVVNFTLNGVNGAPPFRDYLDDLLAALAARGADYVVAATVRNMDLAVPLPGVGTVGVVDRDVILVRSELEPDTAAVPLALSGCRSSVDGCNFAVVASFTTPVGPVAFERGYVAVDMQVAGQAFRVVNTHLEQRLPDYPILAAIQAAQAIELVATIGAFPNPLAGRVMVLGDLNSSPEHPIVTVDGFAAVPPYAQLAEAGYADLWLLRPGKSPGFTCCERADLSNPTPTLTERVDLVFSDALPVSVKANVLGNAPPDKTTPSRLWPSDHAGVVATLEFAP